MTGLSEGVGPEEAAADRLALLFTDVERSTELWQIDEDAFSWALMEHDDEVRECLERHRGVEVKHTGDGFFACFAEVGDAARFSLDLQTRLLSHEWPPELGPVRTRIGFHYGRARRHGDDYRGTAVNLAARVCEASTGGRILLTIDAADALRIFPDLASRTQYLGEVDLPGLGQPVAVYELVCDASQHLAFPAPGSGEAATERRPAAAPAGPTPEPQRGAEDGDEDGEFDEADRRLWHAAREALRQSDFAAAAEVLQQLQAHHPDHVRVLNSLGVACAGLADYDRAETMLRRAVERDPGSASAWFNLARVYGKAGRRDQIGHALTMALRADPSHAKARAVAAKYGIDIDA